MIYAIRICLLACLGILFPGVSGAVITQKDCIPTKNHLCDMVEKSATGASELVITVMNWWDWGPNQGERMEAWVKDTSNYKGKDFSLFGMSELHSDMSADYEPIPLACPGSAEQLKAIDCLARLLNEGQGGRASVRYAGGQYREDGILYNTDQVERISDWITIDLPRRSFLGVESILGKGRTSRKVMVGARFRLKATGHTFHMYATHLDTHNCWKCRIRQTEKISTTVRERYERGDLPPIVVGDFNDSRTEKSYWADDREHVDVQEEMGKYFQDAGALFGYQLIDHIWVGKVEGFPGASEKWEIKGVDVDPNVRNPIALTNGKTMRVSAHRTIVGRLMPGSSFVKTSGSETRN